MHYAQSIIVCLFVSTLTPGKGIAGVRFVDVSNPTPASPFTTWASAATNIQDAVDVADQGDEVMVNDGIYATGGRPFPGQLTNRVVVNKAIVLKSVNGASVTSIVGHQVPGSTNGDGAARCAYVGSNAVLIGFTLSNGGTLTNGLAADSAGGGAWCEVGGWLKDCTISGNAAFRSGGGVHNGNLTNCILLGNRADSGGAATLSYLDHCRVEDNTAVNGGGLDNGTARFSSFVGNSVVPLVDTFNVVVGNGGGAIWSFLENCKFYRNSAHSGGGALGGQAANCVFMSNTAVFFGGGTLSTELDSCTIVANQALRWGSGGAHLGSENKPARNCIIYYNTAPSAPDLLGSMLYCCAPTLWGLASGCITNEPFFVDVSGGNLRLQSNSPCIGEGLTTDDITTVDADGRPRLVGAQVDIGAYEYQGPGMSEFIGWLESFNLPVNGSADKGDSDGDQANSWEEWRAGTDPTSSASVLRMFLPVRLGNDVLLGWESVPGRSYSLLGSAASQTFSPLASNIVAQGSVTTITDTNAARLASRFYRVGVE